MTPTKVSEEFQRQIDEKYGWLKLFFEMEDLLVRVEAANPDVTKLDQVTMVMKYKDFKSFVAGVKGLIEEKLGTGGLVQ